MVRRTDRLYALVEELRARAPKAVSRALLAERLEVTTRTVERDVLALQQAGLPIWSQRGRGGGYAIDAQWNLPPLNLDAAEALAVITALAAARSLPFAEAGRRAAHKLLAGMASGEAERVRELAERMRLEPAVPRPPATVLGAVERAVLDRQVVDIAYRDRGGTITSRPVEAHGLHVSTTASYLVGWCRMRDAARAFRLDRVLSVRPTGEIAGQRQLDQLLDWLDDGVAPELVTERETMTTKAKKAAPKRARQWGPPRKADHRTGSWPGFARAVAEGLPRTEKDERRRMQLFLVEGAVFLELEGDEATVRRGEEGDYSFVLGQVPRDETRALIEEAWGHHAPKRTVTAYNKRRATWAEGPSISEDDVRRIVLAFPDANEGPIWGNDPGFRIGEQKKTRFARFGPPEGSRIGNLLPPDDEHALLIFRCEQRPTLLATAADRFFTTPHYGDPDEPGSVIVRLSELRGPGDLAEISELLEDAWRAAASL